MAGIATTGPLPPTGSAQDPPSSSIGQPSSASRGIDGTAALQSPPPADPKSDMVNHDAAPKSLVAGGTEYPNVPDTAPGQAAGTDPAAGGELAAGSGANGAQTGDAVPFKEQVNGYAKKIAGTIFRNKNEKEFGEAKLQGNA